MQFSPTKRNQPKVNSEECKIKFKDTKHGREVTISKGCTKEQIEMAKETFGTDKVKYEDN